MPIEKRKNIKYHIKEYGCKINQYDSRVLRSNLEKMGKKFTELADADLVIVNTCSVTHRATRDGIRFIKSIRSKFPDKEIMVIGCSVRKDIEGFKELNVISHPGFSFLDHPNNIIENFPGHSRAFIKVQQGCRARCSYCIVKKIKKPYYRRTPDIVIDEARKLSVNHDEIVLSATNFNEYPQLHELLTSIKEEEKINRWRFSSLPPGCITEKLLSMIREDKKFCRHFHLPIQSGSSKILGAMRRTYNQEDIYNAVDLIRTCLSGVQISLDVIVGFPGENLNDFKKTLDFIEYARPLRVHIFRYSERPDTEAYEFSDLVDEKNKRSRYDELDSLCREITMQHYREAVGKNFQVVMEGLSRAYTREYFPVKITDISSAEISVSGEKLVLAKNYDEKGLYAEIIS